jgi:aspartyl aminopeptidase
VRHFHEKLRAQHQVHLSYTWVKRALQMAGLVKKSGKRGVHRRRRPRRPLPGMLLHLDGSSHAWFQDDRRYDLLVILDDATSAIYYAQLVEQESTATVMTALREVIKRKGVCPCRRLTVADIPFLPDPAGNNCNFSRERECLLC